MKAILFLVVVVGVSMVSAKEAQDSTFMDTMRIIAGIMSELNKKGDFKNICGCLDQVPVAVEKFDKFLEVYHTIDWHDLEQIFDVFIAFFDAMKEIFVALKPCARTPTDFKLLWNKLWGVDFDKLMNRFLVHAFEVFGWVTDALKCLEQKEYYKFGVNVGKLMYFIIIDDSVKPYELS